MAGKCERAGAAAGETGALIGADGRNSHLITIPQLFTCLYLLQTREYRRYQMSADYMFTCRFRSIL